MWEAFGEYQGPPSARVFVRYVVARSLRDAEELSYRAYVTDQLRLIPQMMYMSTRWYDVVHGREEDRRTVDEIADDVLARFEE